MKNGVILSIGVKVVWESRKRFTESREREDSRSGVVGRWASRPRDEGLELDCGADADILYGV